MWHCYNLKQMQLTTYVLHSIISTPREEGTSPLSNFVEVNDSQTKGGEIATITLRCLMQELSWLCCMKGNHKQMFRGM